MFFKKTHLNLRILIFQNNFTLKFIFLQPNHFFKFRFKTSNICKQKLAFQRGAGNKG